MLTKIRKPWFSRTITVDVSGDRMKVEHILDFADALRKAGADPSLDVRSHNAYNTGHFCGLTVSWQETVQPAEGDDH